MDDTVKMGSYEAHSLGDGVWIIDDIPEGADFGTCMYLIEGLERALLFDAGDTRGPLKELVEELTTLPVDVVISHGHGDHTAAATQFKRIYMSYGDIDLLHNLFAGEFDELTKERVKDVKAGMIFTLGGRKLELLAVPGHTPGSCALLNRQDQQLFLSDALGSGQLWMQLPGCLTIERYCKSLKALKRAVAGLDALRIFVGHRGRVGGGIYDKRFIDAVLAVCEGLVAGTVTGHPVEGGEGPMEGAWIAGEEGGDGPMVVYDPAHIR